MLEIGSGYARRLSDSALLPRSLRRSTVRAYTDIVRAEYRVQVVPVMAGGSLSFFRPRPSPEAEFESKVDRHYEFVLARPASVTQLAHVLKAVISRSSKPATYILSVFVGLAHLPWRSICTCDGNVHKLNIPPFHLR